MSAISRRFLALAVGLLAAARLTASPAGPLEPGFAGWRQTETPHFLFIYEERDRRAVSQLASFAEEVYDQVTGLLGSHPSRVTVVVAGRVDLANGYTTFSPPHITLYLAPPSEPLIGLEAPQYLRLLLVHELTHFINFEYDTGMFAFLSRLFGPGVKDVNAAFLPTWFLEGIATDTETLFTDGGRGRNPFFEMEYRAFITAHRFFSLGQAAYISYFPPADRDWIGGYLFFRFLLDRYGQDIYARVYQEYVKFPLLGPWKAIERATGKPAGEIYDEMLRELEAKYAALPAVPEGRRVSPDVTGDYFLPVITDRGWYLYRQTLDKGPGIVSFDPLSGGERLLLSTPLTDSSSLSATQDGGRIVFATYEATEGDSGPVVASDLFSLDPASGRVRRITTGARAWQPRLSPDGKRLVAVSAAGPCSRLVEIDPATGSMKLLFSQKDAIVATPSFSPDASRIAFSVTVGGLTSIRVISLSAPEVPVLPQDPIRDFNMDRAAVVVPPSKAGAWYPRFLDNDHLLFSSSENGNLALFSVDTEGRKTERACEDPVGAWAGEQSGDGILYATYRTTGYTLMMKRREQKAQDPLQPGSAVPQPGSAVPQPPAEEVPLPSSPYTDLPRFLAWTPVPVYLSSIASNELVIGPGAVFWGLSNFQTSSYFASASFRTDVLQPGVELSLQTVVGTLGLSYSLSEGYTNLSATDHRQELVQQARLTVPVLSSWVMSTATTLSLSAFVTDSLSAAGNQAFSFTEGLGGQGLSRSHDLAVGVGAGLVRSRPGSPRDLFPRAEVVASGSASAYPPAVSSSGPGVVTSGLFSVSLASPVAHQVIKLGAKASYVGLNETFYQFTNPRGAFDPVIQTLPGRILLSLDYQVPVALLDLPLAYSLGLAGIGCAFHLEAAADWAAAPQVFAPDQDLYAGAELVFDVAVGESFFPVGLGVAIRFDPRFVQPLDWATDVRPYLFVSTDSFAGAGLTGRTPRRR